MSTKVDKHLLPIQCPPTHIPPVRTLHCHPIEPPRGMMANARPPSRLLMSFHLTTVCLHRLVVVVVFFLGDIIATVISVDVERALPRNVPPPHHSQRPTSAMFPWGFGSVLPVGKSEKSWATTFLLPSFRGDIALIVIHISYLGAGRLWKTCFAFLLVSTNRAILCKIGSWIL